jgi:protein-S-isoprenylcysteine O-methyltransferase Ste14
MLLTGGWTDTWMWLYVGAWSAIGLGTLSAIDEDLAQERFHPPEPGADRLPLRAVRLVGVAHLIVGALDTGHWHLAPVVSWLRLVGLVGMVGFAALLIAAMRTNRFFSAVVRIQQERGHQVISSGPYSLIRHPGYAGMITAIPFSALALGSWLGVALAVAYAALIVRRVVFEDAFLQRNLPGYRDYATRLRYRLIPGAW